MNSKLGLEFYQLLKGDTITHGKWIHAAPAWQQACKRYRSIITERFWHFSTQKNNPNKHGRYCLYFFMSRSDEKSE